jgi:hypothetical protein
VGADARSHGSRSASSSGTPADILATFSGGWKSSASATVVLPEPETPITVL